MDLAKDVDPLAIALRQAGLQSCTYKGQKICPHDKTHVIENWHKGEIKVMVCTSAFGMEINQPDMLTLRSTSEYRAVLRVLSKSLGVQAEMEGMLKVC